MVDEQACQPKFEFLINGSLSTSGGFISLNPSSDGTITLIKIYLPTRQSTLAGKYEVKYRAYISKTVEQSASFFVNILDNCSAIPANVLANHQTFPSFNAAGIPILLIDSNQLY